MADTRILLISSLVVMSEIRVSVCLCVFPSGIKTQIINFLPSTGSVDAAEPILVLFTTSARADNQTKDAI